MFEALFGGGMPLAVRFFLAFLIVLGLIAATAWAVRRFGAGRLGAASLRGRQPRLAVIDYASVDARRRLILVRRDNVEHLLMIGGPTDVVVESAIVRAAAPVREAAVTRPPVAAEPLPRAIPLPETGSWPLQPEPVAPPRPAPRIEPLPEEPSISPAAPYAETAARAPRETLAALAEEIAARPPPQRSRAPAAPSRPHPPVEPRMPAMLAGAVEDVGAVDQNLAEMAHRLEAALRKPRTGGERSEAREARETRAPAPAARAAPPPSSPPPEETADAEPEEATAAPPPPSAGAPPRAARPAEGRPQRAEAKPGQGKALYDSLEQEMASLLGRPGKT